MKYDTYTNCFFVVRISSFLDFFNRTWGLVLTFRQSLFFIWQLGCALVDIAVANWSRMTVAESENKSECMDSKPGQKNKVVVILERGAGQ